MAINNVSSTAGAQVHSLGDNRVQQNNNPAAAGQNAAPAAAAASSDSVSLTGTAAQLRQAEAQLASQPVVDAQKVSDVKGQINAGTFEIDPPRIAEKMVQMEQMFGA
jgi:negative regulator of flagellin synthesis FlgM